MGEPKETVRDYELWQAIGKAAAWIGWIIMGTLAKLAFDSRGSKLTKKQIVIKVILSFFSGYSAAVICENTGHGDWAKGVVPMATLLGEGFIVMIMANWRQWLSRLLPVWMRPTQKETDSENIN